MAEVDVLLPVKNGLPFLGQAIESVRAQTMADWRLLVLDHGSTDGSAELAASYAERDRRIQLHIALDADGLAGLLNLGLEKCDCQFIVRQDADDISVPNRFELTIGQFADDPDLLLVGGEATLIDDEGREGGYLSRPHSEKAISAAAFFYNPISHPTVTLSLPAISRVGARYGKDILHALPEHESIQIRGLAEDYFLFSQMALLGPCRNLSVPLVQYRVHDRSVSNSKREAQTACALHISRFLAKSFCKMHGFEPFDPAPFCSHAGYVFDLGASDYLPEFIKMAHALRQGLGSSAELDRELSFRRILASRRNLAMAMHYANFLRLHGFRDIEWYSIRNWMGRHVNNKYVFNVPPKKCGRLPLEDDA